MHGGCEELIRTIGERVCLQREEILGRAEADSRTIIREAEAQREGRLERARIRGEAAARKEASRLASQARIDARREVLAARYEIIEEAMRLLEVELRAFLETEDYRKLVGLLLAEGLAETSAPVTVRCRGEDRRTVEDYALRNGLGISVAESPFPLGGVEIVAGPEGRFIVRNTIADRIDALRPRLLQEANRLLFASPDGGTIP